jgi:hypothetical protein
MGPFATADWSTSWRKTSVTDAEWSHLRDALGAQARQWLTALRTPREVDAIALNGMIASIAHVAYHISAIKQIERIATA